LPILLIDGYNIINRLAELKASLDGGLENARNTLAFLISRWSQRHSAVECVIIFDGDLRFQGGGDQRLAGIRCIFSRTSHGGDERHDLCTIFSPDPPLLRRLARQLIQVGHKGRSLSAE